MKRAQNIMIKALIFYVVIAATLFIVQREMLYHPTNIAPDPSVLGLKDVEVIALDTPDQETLTVWHAAADPGQPTILFLHGNGGEIGDRAFRFATYQKVGFGVLFVSWRGYGGSSGSPTEAGLVTDARAAYDWLRETGVEGSAIALAGESLGTGVAVQLAAEREVGAVVLGAPFTAAADIAARRYPWLPVRLLMKDQFRSSDHIARVTAPILIQHGTADQVVPYDLGHALYELAGTRATFVSVPDAGHQMLNRPDILEREIQFIQNALVP